MRIAPTQRSLSCSLTMTREPLASIGASLGLRRAVARLAGLLAIRVAPRARRPEAELLNALDFAQGNKHPARQMYAFDIPGCDMPPQ